MWNYWHVTNRQVLFNSDGTLHSCDITIQKYDEENKEEKISFYIEGQKADKN